MLSLRGPIAVLLLSLSAPPAWATSFVTRSGGSLELDGSTFRFAGVDLELPIQNAMMDDGSVSHGGSTNFEISAALDNARRLGANVVRVYSFASIGCTQCLEPSPGVWNDQVFARDDYSSPRRARSGSG